jgi:hypothetical protein
VSDLLIADVNNSFPVRDWAQYKAFSPILIAKMTEGVDFLAHTFAGHREGAKEHGLKAFGAFHFWIPGRDPVEQARNAVGALGTLRDDPVEWLFCDVEQGTDFEAYEEFCRFADERLGRVTWMYGGAQLKDHAPHRPRWIATYRIPRTTAIHRAPDVGETLWQFDDGHPVPGVGNCDCSIYRGTADQLVTFIRGGRMATLDKDDLAAIATVVRTVLNEGTGHGQQSWAGTSKALLSSTQGSHNDLAHVKQALAELRDTLGPEGKALVEAIAARLAT